MTDTPDKTQEELIAWMQKIRERAFPNTNKEASATAAYAPIRQEMDRIDMLRDRDHAKALEEDFYSGDAWTPEQQRIITNRRGKT